MINTYHVVLHHSLTQFNIACFNATYHNSTNRITSYHNESNLINKLYHMRRLNCEIFRRYFY